MGEGAAERIDSRLAHVGCDAGQLRRAHIDPGELLPGQVVGDRDGHEAGRVHQIAQHLLAPGVVQRHQLSDLVHGGVGVADLVAGEQQAEVGPVAGQFDAEAIDDASARRWDDPVVVLVGGGEVLIAGRFHQLQLHQPPRERQQSQARGAAHEEGPAVELPLPLVDLLEEDGRFVVHLKRTSASSNLSMSLCENGNKRVVGRNCQKLAITLGGRPVSRMVMM